MYDYEYDTNDDHEIKKKVHCIKVVVCCTYYGDRLHMRIGVDEHKEPCIITPIFRIVHSVMQRVRIPLKPHFCLIDMRIPGIGIVIPPIF
jgi:hypothetical protein